MSVFTKSIMVVGAVVGSCCVLSGIAAVVGGNQNATSATSAAGAPSAVRAPGAVRPAPPVAALTEEALVTLAARAAASTAAAETAATGHHVLEAVEALDEARTVIDSIPPAQRSDARVAPSAASLTTLEATLAASLAPARSILAARRVVDGPAADVLARYDTMRAARDALPDPAVVPRELTAALSRVRRDLERGIAHDERAALELALARELQQRGLVLVTARNLADQFRTNEVVAEDRYKDKRIAVDGIVSEVRTDPFGNAIVDLETSIMFMSVHAETTRATAGRLQRRDRVIFDCECDGMVIGSPQLDECELIQSWR